MNKCNWDLYISCVRQFINLKQQNLLIAISYRGPNRNLSRVQPENNSSARTFNFTVDSVRDTK